MSIQNKFEQFYKNIKLTLHKKKMQSKNIMEYVKNYTIITILIMNIKEFAAKPAAEL